MNIFEIVLVVCAVGILYELIKMNRLSSKTLSETQLEGLKNLLKD